MSNYLIKNTTIVNEGSRFVGDVLIKNGRIEKIANHIDTNFAVGRNGWYRSISFTRCYR